MAVLRRILATVAPLVGLSCAEKTPGRYEVARDPASRYGFTYARDKETGRWVNRECELRVSVRRVLPDPLTDAAHGDRISVQRLGPETAQSAGFMGSEPTLEGDYRTWRTTDAAGKEEVQGRSAYSIAVAWPVEGQETKYDPAEIIPLPPLGNAAPGEWSEWLSASTIREGGFGWWEELHGVPADSLPRPEFPFEVRCRAVFTDVPGRVP